MDSLPPEPLVYYPSRPAPSAPATQERTSNERYMDSTTPMKSKFGDFRVEEREVNGGNGARRPLNRQLKNRHITFLSIGGTIGTGLFLGTASSYAWGGPLGLLLGYSIMGTVCFCVMVSLGEMIAHLPLPGGHITLAARFVDPAFSFTLGWVYWYYCTIVLPAELNAGALLVGFWNTSITPAAWLAIGLSITLAVNMGGTRMYGETEFFFAGIKILLIVGLIILGVIISAGRGPTHQAIGFKFWHAPSGPFRQYLDVEGAFGRFLGVWAVLVQAAFSFLGSEITAIAASEAQNPKVTLPSSIKRVYIRILLFYILGVFVIGILVDSTDPRLSVNSTNGLSSPFVIAIQDAGINILPSIVNGAILTSAWSAANSVLYTSSRTLYGLAINGFAPEVCGYVSSWGLPWVAVLVGASFGLLSFMAAGGPKSSEVFAWFANMTSVCGLLSWGAICWIYIRFYKGLKEQGISRDLFPYKAPFQPFAAWYGLVMCSLVLLFSGFEVFIRDQWSTATFVTSYGPIIVAPLVYVGLKLWTGSRLIDFMEMDYFTGSRHPDDEWKARPTNFVEGVWGWIA